MNPIRPIFDLHNIFFNVEKTRTLYTGLLQLKEV